MSIGFAPHPDLHVEVLIPSGVSPFLETGSFPADVIKSRWCHTGVQYPPNPTCPYKKGRFGHRNRCVYEQNAFWRGRHRLGWCNYKPRLPANPQRGGDRPKIDSSLLPLGTTLDETNQHLDLRFLASKNYEPIISAL